MLTTFLASKYYHRRYNICWYLLATRGFAPVCIQHDFTMFDVGLLYVCIYSICCSVFIFFIFHTLIDGDTVREQTPSRL